MPGSIVLDLGRMTKIHELNTELSYPVIEPGVGYFDL
jgi:4-cresol dehydrogenase (hydroxylating) flavoprotein subunit